MCKNNVNDHYRHYATYEIFDPYLRVHGNFTFPKYNRYLPIRIQKETSKWLGLAEILYNILKNIAGLRTITVLHFSAAGSLSRRI